MGWGTEVTVYASRMDKDNVDNCLEMNQRLIDMYHDELLLLAGATPRVVEVDDGHQLQWEEHVRFRIDEIWDELRDAVVGEFLANEVKSQTQEEYIENNKEI